MAKRLILISPAGERITLHPGDGVVRSEPSGPDDEVTHLIVEPAELEAAASDGADGPPPRGPDIIMSLVGGAPRLGQGTALARSIGSALQLEDLQKLLEDAPDESLRVLFFGRGDGE